MQTVLLASDIYDFNPGLLTSEWESLDSVELLRKEIINLGYRCTIFHSQEKILSSILGFVGAGEKDKLIVWNLIEGYSSRNREGYIPSICEYLGICHTGSDAYAQHITLDKYRTKTIARSLGIKTPDFQIISKNQNFDLNLKFPIFAKPNTEGSSIGITEQNIVKNKEELDSLLSILFESFDTILLEEYIEGFDLTVAIFGNHSDYSASHVARLEYPGKTYSSRIKSKSEMPEKLIFDLNEETSISVQNVSLALAKEIRFSGYARLDFILKGDDIYFLETNLTPGFSPVYSSLPILWQHSGKSYRELVETCLNLAKKEYSEAKRFNYGKGK
ncbi:D-alanine--D-alanine ligase [Leptospira sp. 'Mane']|uniref:D-alanine--D-alanine ligase family protein n=1 Tax=Leptospira sp. 'Mane' TaxID=3387407 RepID=UPI00398B7302